MAERLVNVDRDTPMLLPVDLRHLQLPQAATLTLCRFVLGRLPLSQVFGDQTARPVEHFRNGTVFPRRPTE